ERGGWGEFLLPTKVPLPDRSIRAHRIAGPITMTLVVARSSSHTYARRSSHTYARRGVWGEFLPRARDCGADESANHGLRDEANRGRPLQARSHSLPEALHRARAIHSHQTRYGSAVSSARRACLP